MTKREESKLIELLDLLKKMYRIINSNYYSEMAYALKNIKKIINYLVEILEDETEDFKVVITEIKKAYEAMFIAKTGISEFSIWNEDYNVMYKENREYEKVEKKIRKILGIGRL